MAERALVIGLGVAGASAARRLAQRGWSVTILEDRPSEASRSRAELLGDAVAVVEGASDVEALVAGADVVVPSPGVPIGHPAIQRALATGTRVWTEFELAARWSEVPMVAITGTNGKTTVTTLVEAMLRASGRRTVAAGNTDVPLVDAIEEDLDVIVVEASSFRLEFTETFRPAVAVWLNLAEDHLDWHPSMEAYAAAKARIWAAQGPDDVAIVNAEDPVVLAASASAPSRVVTFGLTTGDWHVADGQLVRPDGSSLLAVADLWRALPHDCTNALAAAAAALAAGADDDGVRAALRDFRGLPHRLALVGDDGEVRYYDDSKATDPHATVAALRSFESAVLIAGGRNKGLDLSVLAEEVAHVRAVVAIGESAPEIEAAFTGLVPVSTATSMDAAVAAARAAARPGDAVVLSPGCASFDWYRNYGERGDDFARAVREVLA
ncbi:MAG: UDP-N-acetylmuramoylalanine--D-glutamate ligase [Actinomycetota bacterium]|nr:UDP-N-acetylmuramoylalanine--D-glutamate ligase [Actinomycetota bacterium]